MGSGWELLDTYASTLGRTLTRLFVLAIYAQALSIGIGQGIPEATISYGQTRVSYLPAYIEHYWYFSGIAGETVSIQLDGEFEVFLGLLGPEWEWLAYDNRGGNSNSLISDFTLPNTGTYTIVVRGYRADASGPYRLSLWRPPRTSGAHGGPTVPDDASPLLPLDREALLGEIPHFPWPPPEASGLEVLPEAFFLSDNPETLSDIDRKLRFALDFAGYFEKRYYMVPNGFAMVTRLEQINDDGSSKSEPDRWAADVGPVGKFSLESIFRALFTANPGHYRIIVFIVTTEPFTNTGAPVNRDEAMAWLRAGLNVLPVEIGNRRYFPGYHNITALIYEFEQPGPGSEATLKVPGRLSSRTHLTGSRLWDALGQ